MKYNEELFKMSIPANNNNEKSVDKKDNEAIKRELLKLMIEKLKIAMLDPEVLDKGYAKIDFIREAYVKPEPGYNEIAELIRSNEFYTFASEYGIYLTYRNEHFDDYVNASYELTWYFKEYFDSMNKEAVQRTLKPSNKGDN